MSEVSTSTRCMNTPTGHSVALPPRRDSDAFLPRQVFGASTWNYHVAKRKSVATNIFVTIREVMVRERMDFIAGDVNGTAWETEGHNPICRVFHNTAVPLPASGASLRGSGATPG